MSLQLNSLTYIFIMAAEISVELLWTYTLDNYLVVEIKTVIIWNNVSTVYLWKVYESAKHSFSLEFVMSSASLSCGRLAWHQLAKQGFSFCDHLVKSVVQKSLDWPCFSTSTRPRVSAQRWPWRWPSGRKLDGLWKCRPSEHPGVGLAHMADEL